MNSDQFFHADRMLPVRISRSGPPKLGPNTARPGDLAELRVVPVDLEVKSSDGIQGHLTSILDSAALVALQRLTTVEEDRDAHRINHSGPGAAPAWLLPFPGGPSALEHQRVLQWPGSSFLVAPALQLRLGVPLTALLAAGMPVAGGLPCWKARVTSEPEERPWTQRLLLLASRTMSRPPPVRRVHVRAFYLPHLTCTGRVARMVWPPEGRFPNLPQARLRARFVARHLHVPPQWAGRTTLRSVEAMSVVSSRPLGDLSSPARTAVTASRPTTAWHLRWPQLPHLGPWAPGLVPHAMRLPSSRP